ncbi:MAG TPA: peptidase T [Opitutaceae bacterium]|nr:peptidase T [Opitutaceae bacterium]
MTYSIDAEDLLERFCRYVRLDTRSDPHSDTCPSTPGQWDLLRLLESELKEIGAAEVRLTPEGYVLATLPATSPNAGAPRIAWLAHVDTATELPGGAKPIVHRKYDGKPIELPDDPTQQLTVETTPQLRGKTGDDIITASGTTLLGADDKAGVAVVMSAVRHLRHHPEIPHGVIRVCFNPDEEIARGMTKLKLDELAADVGYTLDGEDLGEIDYETFSADAAVLEIRGVSIHPGWAKGVMVNALRLAGSFLSALPAEISPERTAGREGFIHPVEVDGNADHCTVRLILRDFELAGLAAKRAAVEQVVSGLRIIEPRAVFALTFSEQYRNMRYWLEKDMRPVELAREAVRRAGVTPLSTAIRGGTDGSNLTARGLPCPNIFCGMREAHSRREWVSLQDMKKSAETLLHLAELWLEKAAP